MSTRGKGLQDQERYYFYITFNRRTNIAQFGEESKLFKERLFCLQWQYGYDFFVFLLKGLTKLEYLCENTVLKKLVPLPNNNR